MKFINWLMLLLIIGLIIFCVWSKYTHKVPKPLPQEIYPFIGNKAEPIDWDLTGDWNVSQWVKAAIGEKPEPIVFHWSLTTTQYSSLWKDKLTENSYVLFRKPSGGDMILWYKGNDLILLSINSQTKDCLQMSGDNGEFYIAVRK